MPFDDDDNPAQAEQPSSQNNGNGDGAPTTEEAMEDGVPDYKLFASMFSKKGAASKTIRKGEKDFESHGTKAQDSTLESSRQALEEVLSYTRVHKPDSWLRAWLFPNWWIENEPTTQQDGMMIEDRVVVMEHERGSWMKDIGRTVSGSKDQLGVGRLWLLPEEALYLIERGTIDIWWPDASFAELLPKVDASAAGGGGAGQREGFGPDDYDVGLPLSLEAAYSFLVGYEGDRGKTTLPKFQVYTHLKRAGFHVLRAPKTTTQTAQDGDSSSSSSSSSQTVWQWLFSFINGDSQPKHNQFGPLVSPGIYRAYRPIYQQLALLPRHKPSVVPPESNEVEEPFRVHFHVWKPGGAPFTKKNPPPPDFRIAVVDADESSVPTLEQVEALLESTPYDPPNNPQWQGPGRLYQRLKHGYRNVLVAIVDRGIVNFMRFGEAAFGEEILFNRFDNRGPGRGGKRGGRRGGGGRGRGRGRGRGGKR